MDLPTALLRHVLDLTRSVGADDGDLPRSLIALAADLQAAVPSYRGVHLTVALDGDAVELVHLLPPEDGESIRTSLRLPLLALGTGFDPASRVVMYAAAPGAFVDLAADLRYELDGQSRELALDADLPPPRQTSGLSGLSELSIVNRAIGVLIDRGELPDRARATLAHRASRDGVETHVYAARLLREVRDGLRRAPDGAG